jgi:putative AlgH/UPF0301 family transcriptional regulator
MSLTTLFFFATLTTVVAFPTVRTSELDARQSDARPTRPAIKTVPAASLPLPSKDPKDLGPGRVLVASRELADPSFAGTVILLVHYDNEGVVGLMLNRRTDLPVSRVLSRLEAAKRRSDPVYLGGPVETPTVFALFRSREKVESAEHVFGGVYWIAKKDALEKAISSHSDPAVLHIYLGYAGWTANQLRNEVLLGGWFIFQADNQTVFNANPDSLWRQMIRKTELKLAGPDKRLNLDGVVKQYSRLSRGIHPADKDDRVAAGLLRPQRGSF